MKNPFKGVKKALTSKGALKKLTGADDIEELKVYFDMYPDEQENFIWFATKVMRLKNPKAHYIIAAIHHDQVMAKAVAARLTGSAKRKFDRAFKRKKKVIDKTVKKLSDGVKEDERA